MSEKRRTRIVGVLVLGTGMALATAAMGASVAGATGSTPAPFTIKVDGANSSAVTTSPVSTVVVSGLPSGATGSVEIDQAGSALCTVTLPSHTCSTGSLSPGSYPGITGSYTGDGTYAGSTSTNSVDLTVLTPGGSSTVCSKMSGYVTKKISFSFCQLNQKGGHLTGSDLLTGGTITWNRSKTTTVYSGSATSPGQGSCPAAHTEQIFSGTVTADTSTFAAVGGAVSYDICVSTKGVVKLLLGTKATI